MTTTSFQRKINTGRPNIPGTKSACQELLISTGVNSLDEVLGGGLAVGSLFLIEEESGTVYGQLLSKYFIAEGASNDHRIILYSSDAPSEILLKNIPTVVEIERTARAPAAALDEPLKIAWRYQNVKSAPPSPCLKSRSFDWNQPLTQEKLSRVTSYHGPSTYSGILTHLAMEVQSHNSNNQVLRLIIHGLGSPLWEDEEEIFKFLFALRSLCRTFLITCFITTPSYWLNHELGRKRQIRRLADVVIELRTLQDSEKQKRPHLKNYTGVIYFHRLCRPCSYFMRPTNDTRDLAFSVKRKNFIIERIHLPPALDEAPAIKTTPRNMCSSHPGSSVLDF